MPRTPSDLAYERATVDAEFLTSKCDIKRYQTDLDGRGGFRRGTFQSRISNVPCRIDEDARPTPRSDSTGEEVRTDYSIQISALHGINLQELAGTLAYPGHWIEIDVQEIDGVNVSATRFFTVVGVPLISEGTALTVRVREND